MLLYGYLVGDYSVSLNDPAPSLVIRIKPGFRNVSAYREVRGVLPKFRFNHPELGRPLYLPYIPSSHPVNMIAASIHRFGRDMPKGDVNVLLDFKRYALRFIVLYFTPLQQCDVPTFTEWLERSPYSGARRKALLLLRERVSSLRSYEDWKALIEDSKSFIKWEGYEEPKNARGINSPSDLSKTILGPLQYAVDKGTFKTKWFVKGSNPKTWPEKMLHLFGEEPVMGTDFSSFEAHHWGVFADVVLAWMKHMTQNVSAEHYRRLVQRMVRGVNYTQFSALMAEIDQRLMSGAMHTSSANGVLNLLIMSFINGRAVYPEMDPEMLATLVDEFFTGLVEGDDGICRDRKVSQTLIDRMGVVLKFDRYKKFSDASFCGVVCCPDELKVVMNPLKVLRNFFVLHPSLAQCPDRVHMAMLRAKALSYKYMLNDCPIIGALAHKVCEVTRGLETKNIIGHMDSWKLDSYFEAVKAKMWFVEPKVSARSRAIVERHFGIAVSDQLRLEQTIRSSTHAIEFDLDMYSKRLDAHHALRYCFYEGEEIPLRGYGELPPIISQALEGRLVGKHSKECRREKAMFDEVGTQVPYHL